MKSNNNLNSYHIEIKTLKDKSRNISITYNDFDFSDNGELDLSYTFNTKSNAYDNLEDGIIDTTKLNSSQKRYIEQSIEAKRKSNDIKSKNKMRENIIGSAVEDLKRNKDKNLDTSEFEFNSDGVPTLTEMTDDKYTSAFDFDEPLSNNEKNSEFIEIPDVIVDEFDFTELEDIKLPNQVKETLEEIKNKIKLTDKKIQTELDLIIHNKMCIARAERTIILLKEIQNKTQENLNQYIEDKIRLKLDLDDIK